MNKAMRRMVAKMEALTKRVADLERAAALRAAFERAEFQAKHSTKDMEDLAAFAKENVPGREKALELSRIVTPMLALIPADARAQVVAESTPADLIEALREESAKAQPELAPILDATATALRHHGLTWADMGVGADGSMA